MARLTCLSLFVLSLLLSRSLRTSAHEGRVDVLNPDRKGESPAKTRELGSAGSSKLRVYARKRSGSGGLATRTQGKDSADAGARPASVLLAGLCLSLLLCVFTP